MQLAWQTVQFVKKVSEAQAGARALYLKTNRVFKLIKSVDSRLHIRRELRGSEPPASEEAEIEKTIKDSLSACRQCLLSINRKIRTLSDGEEIDATSRVVLSIRFTLSAQTIKKKEQEIETNIQALATSLSLLQLLEHEGTQKKVDRLEKTVHKAIAHLQTIPQNPAPNQSPIPHDSSPETSVVQNDCEIELLGTRSLEKCIEIAQSVRSSHGSTIAHDTRSLESIEVDSSSDERDMEEGGDTEEMTSDSTPTGEQIPATGEDGLDLNAVNPMEDPTGEHDYPSDMLELEMKEYQEHGKREYEAENFAAAERHQEKAISHGEILEQQGYRPFDDQVQMRKYLADIYMKQEKYAEATRVLNRLLPDSDATSTSPEQTLEEAMLWHQFAKVRYLSFLKNKNRNRNVAERDLSAAEGYAIKKSYVALKELLKQSAIDEKHPAILDCVKLVIQILEDQGNTVKALAWRRRWLGQPPLSQTMTSANNPEIETQIQDEAGEAILKQLNSPGRTALINSILFNLPQEFQKILDADIDVEERCEDGFTPIMHAAACEHEGDCGCVMAIHKLVDRKANIKATSGASQVTSLHRAVMAGNCQTVQVLLEWGADPNASTPNTPLALAVKQNRASVTKHLLGSGGADIHVVDSDKWTLLHHAVSNNAHDALLVLLHRNREDSQGIDLEAPSSQGLTALMHAAERASKLQSYALAKALIDHGAKVNATDLIGRSPLCFAITGPCTPVREKFARLLLDNHADTKPVQEKMAKRVKEYPVVREHVLSLRRRDSGVSLTNRRSSAGTTRSESSELTTETRKTNRSKKSVIGNLLGKSRSQPREKNRGVWKDRREASADERWPIIDLLSVRSRVSN